MGRCTELDQFVPTWLAAFRAGDVNGVADLYEDDAIFAPPDEPAVWGKTAIRAWFAASFPAMEVLGVQFGPHTRQVVGDYAFGTMAAQFTLRLREGDAAAFDVDGFATEVLHRGADGGWRYHINLGSAVPPAAM